MHLSLDLLVTLPGGQKVRLTKSLLSALRQTALIALPTPFSRRRRRYAELTQDPTMTPVEKLCVAVMIKAVEKGDPGAMNTILDRFIGKVKENVEVKTVQTDINDFRSLTDEEIMRRRELLVSAGE